MVNNIHISVICQRSGARPPWKCGSTSTSAMRTGGIIGAEQDDELLVPVPR